MGQGVGQAEGTELRACAQTQGLLTEESEGQKPPRLSLGLSGFLKKYA